MLFLMLVGTQRFVAIPVRCRYGNNFVVAVYGVSNVFEARIRMLLLLLILWSGCLLMPLPKANILPGYGINVDDGSCYS